MVSRAREAPVRAVSAICSLDKPACLSRRCCRPFTALTTLPCQLGTAGNAYPLPSFSMLLWRLSASDGSFHLLCGAAARPLPAQLKPACLAQHRGDRRLVADDTRGPPPGSCDRASPPRWAACGAPRLTGRTGRAARAGMHPRPARAPAGRRCQYFGAPSMMLPALKLPKLAARAM